MLAAIAFYVLAAGTIGAGLLVVFARNPVHSVLFLIAAFVSAAGLFVLLSAEFLAMLLVVVYVGAVAVLFLFVVMMLDIDFAQLREGFARYLPLGGLVAGVLAIEMVLGHEIFRSEGGGGGRTGSVVPVAFPIIAGSGTLTTVMSLKSSFDTYNILLGIAINLLIIFLCLRSLRLIERLLGPSGILVVRKFFGVILLAIAIKIFRTNVGI